MTSMSPGEVFKGKRFTVMGLDAAGRGFHDAKYLLKNGAEVIGTDLKNAEYLPEVVALAREYPSLTLILGEHRLQDFYDRDYVIRAALAPLDSPYLAEARKNNIPVVSDETLFLKFAPKVLTTGVTGTRGKTTVTYLIYEILKAAGHRTFLGGNVQGTSLLPLLDEVKEGDSIVMELDSWKLQSFAENGISPHIAVFTSFFPDHLNYYKGDPSTGRTGMKCYFDDKSAIFRNQKDGDMLFVNEKMADVLEDRGCGGMIRDLRITPKIPDDWKMKILGEHNRENASLALAVARSLNVPDDISRRAIENFEGVPGRLQYLGSKSGVEYYNDTTATSPEGVMAALSALNRPGRIVLIGGGADKRLEYGEWANAVMRNVKALILFKGEASEKMLKELSVWDDDSSKIEIYDSITSMSEAIDRARKIAEEGDIILLSPGAASFGVFKNEYDRGDQFIEQFNGLRS